MTKALYLLLVSSMLISKSSDATLTVYKGLPLSNSQLLGRFLQGKVMLPGAGYPMEFIRTHHFLILMELIFYHNDLMITSFLVLITSVHYEESKFR